MKATEELKPCPFCGNKAHTITTSSICAPWSNVGLNALGVAVVCDVCGATQPAQMDEEKAVEYWNRRAEQAIAATLGRGECHDMYTDDDEWFACSECNTELRVHEPFGVIGSIRFCPNCGKEVVDE